MPTIQIEDGISLEDYLLDLLVEVAVTPTIDAVLGRAGRRTGGGGTGG